MTTRGAPRYVAIAVAVFLATACDAPSSSPTAVPLATGAVGTTAIGTPPGATPPASAGEFVPDPSLLAAAIGEGFVTTVGLPEVTCNTGELVSTFRERTGLEVNEQLPDAGAADVLEALIAARDEPGSPGPDVVSLDLAAAPEAQAEDLLQPHVVASRDGIPASARDVDGYWWGTSFGIMAFEVNTEVVAAPPRDWGDLLRDEYAAQVSLSGDPQTSSEAMYAVYAAGLANGGTLDDASPGLELFGDLNAAGTFLPVVAKTGTVAEGETPIRLAWTYHALADRAALEGTAEVEVVVPGSGRIAGVSVQAISRAAPHPNAARLWMEFVSSDEGQLLLLEGSCHPIRYEQLAAAGRIAPALLGRLPNLEGVTYPTAAQAGAAASLVAARWDDVVGVDIVCTLECE